jgi:hypothetical protein
METLLTGIYFGMCGVFWLFLAIYFTQELHFGSEPDYFDAFLGIMCGFLLAAVWPIAVPFGALAFAVRWLAIRVSFSFKK